MRKLILKTAACLLLSFVSLSAFADPKPPVPQFYGLTKSSDAPITRSNPYALGKRDTEGNTDPLPEGTPLTPATVLLLTLASGFAGVKIYRNNKEK